MKKAYIEDGKLKEKKIISTNDIYVGVDDSSSLTDIIENQNEKIKRIEKYTKWYVKYGGLGSGGSGGGSSTSQWSYTAYIEKDTFSKQLVAADAINLDGNGTYTLRVNISHAQGHMFTVFYRYIDSSYSKKVIAAGESEAVISLSVNDKGIFSMYVQDTTEEETSNVYQTTFVPNSYLVSTSLTNSRGSSISEGQNIIINQYSGLTATFYATLYENVDVYYAVSYILEGQNEVFINGYSKEDEKQFTKPGTESSYSGTYPVSFSSVTFDEDSDIGRTVVINLYYGEDFNSKISTTTNIIPEGYYIVLSDTNNGLYSEFDPTKTPEKKTTRGYLSTFNLTLTSNITGENKDITITTSRYENNEWVDVDSTKTTIQTNSKYNLKDIYKKTFTNGGWYKIEAETIDSSKTYKTVKYFYIESVTNDWTYTSFEDYVGSDSSKRTTTYCYYEDNKTPYLKSVASFYKNSSEISLGKAFTTTVASSINISLGLQYDSSNDENKTIFTLNSSTKTNETLKVTQNGIYRGNSSTALLNYYLPLTENCDSTSTSMNDWHLFNLNIHYVDTPDNGSYYEFTVSIDGVLDGIAIDVNGSGKTSAINTVIDYNTITLNPDEDLLLNMNLFEIKKSNLTSAINVDTNPYYNTEGYLFDIDASMYYNYYFSEVTGQKVSGDTVVFNNNLKKFKFDKYNLPYTDENTINTMIGLVDANSNKLITTPFVILKVPFVDSENKYYQNFFTDWFLAKWPESGVEPSSINGRLVYISNKNTTDTIDSCTRKEGFVFDIQGSSTRGYGNKNINVSIVQSDGTTVFTPNFDKNDTDTFLPEQTFTLKADIVDSSACNNNAIGKFINEYTLPLDSTNCPARNTSVSSHIKNCLTGFPVLVFINVTGDTSEISDNYYFAGIYNFNLGRDSYFNLGYYTDKSYEGKVEGLMTGQTQGEFQVLTLDNKPELFSNLSVAEISNGKPYFDFSQYDSSVLFNEDKDDDNAMFSDCVMGNEDTFKNKIQNVVKYISKGCGYIFDKLGKHRYAITDTTVKDEKTLAYNINLSGTSCNCVPDYQTQYTRVLGTNEFKEKSEKDPAAMQSDLIQCICIQDSEGGVTPYLDLRSTVEYYTICMIFSMVDSVMKNLEIKSWNNKTIFPAFYDMDTALGIDNNGGDVDYFAFSDYWSNNESLDGDIYIAKGVNIYPDYKYGSSGFDIPSSYLLGIAKYATLDIVGISDYLPKMSKDDKIFGTLINDFINISPANIYSLLRDSNSGPLRTASYFIKTYFSDRLKAIPNGFKNLNYRSKYCKTGYWGLSDYELSIIDKKESKQIPINYLEDINKFKGSGIYKKTDWFNHRLHLLDAYFNTSTDIKYNIATTNLATDESGHITAVTWYNIEKTSSPNISYYNYPTRDTDTAIILNDCDINTQIFNDTRDKFNASNIQVKCPSYTPIVMYQAGANPQPYLIGDDNGTIYKLSLASTGSQTWGIYGSRSLTYINDLGQFETKGQTITSSKLKNINFEPVSSTGSYDSFTLVTPNVESISFNGKMYGGNLTLQNTFSRLQEISLTNTVLACEYAKESPLTAITLNTITSDTISFINQNSLTYVALTNCTISNLTLPIWSNTISLTKKNVKTKKLTLATNNSFTDSIITITGIDELTNVTIGQAKSVIIKNCKNLTNVSFDKNLINLSIINCGENSSQLGTTDSILDLSNCTSLKTLSLYTSRHIETVKIGSNVTLAAGSCSGCTELKYLDSEDYCKYLISGNRVFRGCYNLTLKKGEDKGYSNVIVSGTKDISYTFYNDVESNEIHGSIDFGAADNFITANKDMGVTNISYLFTGHNIVISGGTNQTCFTHLSSYTSVTNADYAFEWNYISYWSKDLFNFGKSLEYNGIFYPSGNDLRIEVDFLENMGAKFTSWDDKDSTGSNHRYTFVSGNSTTSNVELYDVFKYLTNITSFFGFNTNYGNTNLSLRDCFKNCGNLSKITSFLCNCTNLINITYSDDNGNTTSCFKCLSNLVAVDRMFSYGITETIDLFNLFTEAQWGQFNNIFTGDTKNYDNRFGANKIISLDNYKTLVNWINSNDSSNGLCYVFRNCTISGCTDTDTGRPNVGFNFTKNKKYTSLYRLFENLKAVDSNNNEVPINLEENFFEYLPNVTTATRMFSGIWFNNSIPFDFFRKRNETMYTNVYTKNIKTIPIPEEISSGNTIYYNYFSGLTNSIEDAPALPTVSEEGKVTEFNGWSINKQECKYTQRTIFYCCRSKVKPTEGKWEFSGTTIYEKFEDPICVSGRTRVYNNATITEASYMFYNCRFRTPYFNYNKETFVDEHKSYIVDADGNSYDEWYSDNECTSPLPYDKSVEIEDLNVTTDISDGPTLNYKKFKSFTIKQTNTDKDYPFISPDFFYGMGAANITSIFETTVTRTDITNDKYILEGFIPKHLFSGKSQKIGDYSDFMKNLNILPVLFYENVSNGLNTHRYIFIQDGFTDGLTNFENLFNFHIRLPQVASDSDSYEYYVISNSSLKNTTSTFQNTFPMYALHGNENSPQATIFYDNNAILDITNKDNATKSFNYYLLYDGISTYTGFDDYKSTSLDNLISGDLMYVVSGVLFKDYNLKITDISKASESNYVVYGLNQSKNYKRGGINPYFQFPNTTETFGDKNLLYKQNFYFINKSSIYDYDKTKSYWNGTYNNTITWQQ